MRIEFRPECDNCENRTILEEWAALVEATESGVESARGDAQVKSEGVVLCAGPNGELGTQKEDGFYYCPSKVSAPDIRLIVDSTTPIPLEIPIPVETPRLVGKEILGHPWGHRIKINS
jgi:hypothetical protein